MLNLVAAVSQSNRVNTSFLLILLIVAPFIAIKEAHFFFDPLQLSGEFAYLGVQSLELPLVSGLCGSLLTGCLVGEDGGEGLQGLVTPLVQLVGVNAVFGGQL